MSRTVAEKISARIAELESETNALLDEMRTRTLADQMQVLDSAVSDLFSDTTFVLLLHIWRDHPDLEAKPAALGLPKAHSLPREDLLAVSDRVQAQQQGLEALAVRVEAEVADEQDAEYLAALRTTIAAAERVRGNLSQLARSAVGRKGD